MKTITMCVYFESSHYTTQQVYVAVMVSDGSRNEFNVFFPTKTPNAPKKVFTLKIFFPNTFKKKSRIVLNSMRHWRAFLKSNPIGAAHSGYLQSNGIHWSAARKFPDMTHTKATNICPSNF